MPVRKIGFELSATNSCLGGDYFGQVVGKKQYEITNHLGNVLATVSDRRLSKDVYSYTTSGSGNYKYDAVRNMYYAVTAGTGTHNRVTSSSDNKTDWYTADVTSYSDYYAYGEQQHGRFGGVYRYDFNGKETDPESDLQDYGMRIYNARLGKFLSVDPLTSSYPWYTPYQFAGNMPIMCIDLDGCEPTIPGTQEGQHQDAPVQGHENWGSNYHWIWLNNSWHSSVVAPSSSAPTYSGGVRVYEAAEASGSVPGASSVAGYSFLVGGYTITPNYLINDQGSQVFSHYTASVMINNPDPASGFAQMARIDYVFGAADLSAFKENVHMYATAANLMFGGSAHLSQWQIDKLNGSGTWGVGYLGEQWSNPYAVGLCVGGTLLSLAELQAISNPKATSPSYAPKVRERALMDPRAHNFPYSFDPFILDTKPVLAPNGYRYFRMNGYMNGNSGIFEIGMRKDGVIDHRVFKSK